MKSIISPECQKYKISKYTAIIHIALFGWQFRQIKKKLCIQYFSTSNRPNNTLFNPTFQQKRNYKKSRIETMQGGNKSSWRCPLQFPYNSEVGNMKMTTLLCSNLQRLWTTTHPPLTKTTEFLKNNVTLVYILKTCSTVQDQSTFSLLVPP